MTKTAKIVMTKTAKIVRLAPNTIRNPDRVRGYRWNDQDPVLAEITTLISESGLSAKEIATRVNTVSHGAANVARGTIANWLSGLVRRPQNWTITWVAYSLGYERRWAKIRPSKGTDQP